MSLSLTSDKRFADVFLPSTAALLLVTTPLAALGLSLGARVGLGAPLLTALLLRRPGALRQILRVAAAAAGVGVSIGFLLLLLRVVAADLQSPALPELGHRGVLGGFLVSVSAAIGEEVWLRLGVMTTLAWLLTKTVGQDNLTPRIAWAAILVSALAFGAIHLPQLAAAGAATVFGVTGTMFGNAIVGIACGWLFWKFGIISAIAAHFAIDIVLHVLPALLS